MNRQVGASFPTAFATALRQAGVAVSGRSVVMFTEALTQVDLACREQVFWAAHACLLTRPEDREVLDRVFIAFFGGPATLDGDDARPVADDEVVLDGTDPAANPATAEHRPGALRFSTREVLGRKDFSRCTPDELAELARLITDLGARPPMRPSRRRRHVAGAKGRFDLPTTARLAVQTLGEPIRVGRTVSTARPRRLVLLLDVSGSMDAYSRELLRFAHGAARGRSRVEVFALGTRLTRLTRTLRTHDADAALHRAADEVVDQGGGTRLGATMRQFNDEWGIRGLARGATVVVCSDGWDRGDPEQLGDQVERLSRVTHRLVWVNPLKASEGYAPLAGGMAAALPHLDDFVAGNSLDALERLADVIAA